MGLEPVAMEQGQNSQKLEVEWDAWLDSLSVLSS